MKSNIMAQFSCLTLKRQMTEMKEFEMRKTVGSRLEREVSGTVVVV